VTAFGTSHCNRRIQPFSRSARKVAYLDLVIEVVRRLHADPGFTARQARRMLTCQARRT
jgi:hypothetical protein